MSEKNDSSQQPLSKFERERQALEDRSQERLEKMLARVKARGDLVGPSDVTVARAEAFEAKLMDNRKKRRATTAATAAVLGAISGDRAPKERVEPAAPQASTSDEPPAAESMLASSPLQEDESNVFSEFFGLVGQDPKNASE